MFIPSGICALALVLITRVPPSSVEGVAEKARNEYFVVSANGGAEAFNRAQRFRVTFPAGGGVLVRPISNGGESHDGSIALTSAGRHGRLAPVADAPLSVIDDRVERKHGGLVEWYMNGEAGLEQGFTFAAPPEGDGEVEIELALGGSLVAHERDGGLDLVSPDGSTALRYDHLAAFDADHRELPAAMIVSKNAVRITVNDRDAKYPITIDPLFSYPTWFVEGNQNTAYFGTSVASAGDVNGDGFSDVIVGAPGFTNIATDDGRVFVYLGSQAGLATAAGWTVKGDQTLSDFGRCVASAGDVNGDGYDDVIVGAPNYDTLFPDAGRAFLYLGSALGPSTTPSWTASSGQAGAGFGRSVASAGDVNGDGYDDVIVGANTFTNGQSSEGRAFLYLGSPTGLAATPAWSAESDQANAYFGYSVASAGDVNGDGFSDVIVGAPFHDHGELDEGRAHVFQGSTIGLGASAVWTVESNVILSAFGYSVASAGDVNSDGYSDVVVGAPYLSNGQGTEGGAFAYLGSASGLATTVSWTAESNQSGAEFGISVASAGDSDGDGFDDVLIGSQQQTVNFTPMGRAFLYLGHASGLAPNFLWSGNNNVKDSTFGASVASAGDVNGDGFSDAIIGAPQYSYSKTKEGVAYMYFGKPSCSGYGTASNYGSGKIGTNGPTYLGTFQEPHLGETVLLAISNGFANASPAILFVGFAPASIPFDKGTLLVAPFATYYLPGLDAAGNFYLYVPLPPDAAICGLHLYLQAMFPDPGATGFYHTAQTNGVHWVIGN